MTPPGTILKAFIKFFPFIVSVRIRKFLSFGTLDLYGDVL